MKRVLQILPVLVLCGCASGLNGVFSAPPAPGAPVVRDGSAEIHPRARPGPAAPPRGARTAEALDTTSAEDRERALAQGGVSDAGDTDLGLTIASLGAVAEPGLWLKTPLVDAPAKGRVAYEETGAAVAVELLPLDAEPGAGSQLSLAAMRLIGADLTALPELRVFRTR